MGSSVVVVAFFASETMQNDNDHPERRFSELANLPNLVITGYGAVKLDVRVLIWQFY